MPEHDLAEYHLAEHDLAEHDLAEHHVTEGAPREDELRGRRLRVPLVTSAIIAGVATAAVRLGTFSRGLPTAVSIQYAYSGRGLLDHRWSTLLSAQILTRDRFMAVSIMVSLAIFLGGYELLAGWWRALIVAGGSAVAGPLAVTAVLGLGSALGWEFADRTLLTLDYGASAITAGAAGALVATLDSKRFRWTAIAFVGAGLGLHHQIADWIHVAAFPTGFGIAQLVGQRSAVTEPAMRRMAHRRPIVLLTTAIGITSAVLVGSIGVAHAGVPLGRSTLHVSVTGRGAASSVAGVEGPDSPAQVLTTTYHSAALGADRNVVVVLPPNYYGGSRRYPVIEMLHGSPGSGIAIVSSLDVVGLISKVPAFIAVLPDGNGPSVSEGDYANTSRQQLGTATGAELRSWADSTYRTTTVWSVAGLSSGGFGAAYLGSSAMGGYDSVCAMSGHFRAVPPAFAGQSADLVRRSSPINLVSPTGPRTLLITGDHDATVLADTKAYANALDRAGQPRDPIVTLPGGHEVDVWRPGLELCVRFALQLDH